jgi:ribosomal protein S18 acetylase RimI-like enzyme
LTLALAVEPLNTSLDRRSFDCGVAVLDRYFREQASQDVKRRLGNCFVALDRDADTVAAYYTLAASSVPFAALPEADTRRLPRYPVLPATLVGRLAVDRRYQGRKIGSALIADALHRSVRAEPASFTLLVDAKDDSAAAFYRKHGFAPLASRPLAMFLPIATALKLFGPAEQ